MITDYTRCRCKGELAVVERAVKGSSTFCKVTDLTPCLCAAARAAVGMPWRSVVDVVKNDLTPRLCLAAAYDWE